MLRNTFTCLGEFGCLYKSSVIFDDKGIYTIINEIGYNSILSSKIYTKIYVIKGK